MAEIRAARAAYEQAQEDARALVARARLDLGRTIYEARREGTSQEAIAKDLDLGREQVRKFQREFEDKTGSPKVG